MQAVRVIRAREDRPHIDERNAGALRFHHGRNRPDVRAVAGVGPSPERNDLGNDDVHTRQARENLVEQDRQRGQRRGAVIVAEIVGAGVQQHNVRPVGLKPPVGVQADGDLLGRPARMAFVRGIGHHVDATLHRADEAGRVALAREQRPQEPPVAAVPRVGRTKRDRIAERHDPDGAVGNSGAGRGRCPRRCRHRDRLCGQSRERGRRNHHQSKCAGTVPTTSAHDVCMSPGTGAPVDGQAAAGLNALRFGRAQRSGGLHTKRNMTTNGHPFAMIQGLMEACQRIAGRLGNVIVRSFAQED
jgi:hypothetical protein